ncbi:MAG: cadherin repeat domain-containing protein, partial [Dolichospermum sp.]
INSSIGTLSSTDNDAGETFTYTLVSGSGSTDNSNFNISGNSLRTNVVLNYTSKSSHNIRVRTTDANGCYFEQTFTITVNDVNTAPTEIFISDSTVNENSPALTIVGSFSALDNDVNDVYYYSLVSGVGSTNNASFNINGTNLRTTAIFNNEVKSSYSIRVRVTDGASNTFERVFTILVDDINDLPTDIKINSSSSGTNFADNKPLGSLVGYLSTTDEDVNNTFTYSFVDVTGNNNSDFSIVGSQLRTNKLFDYETRQNYVVFVQTNDGMGGTFTKQLLLQVVDSNDAPTSINLTNTSISENLSSNTFIAKLSANDPDASSTHSFSLVNGTGSSGNSNFTIRNDSLFSSVSFDFESVSSYSIRLNVSDGMGGVYQQTFSITVLNANDTPTEININSNQIAENQAANTVIGSLSTADQDANNTFIYTLVSGAGGTDNAAFNISGNNLRSSVSFDFETKNSYSIRLRSTDNGGAYFEKIMLIQVTNVIDAPTNILISNDTINENLASNTLIGTLSGVSQDASPSFTYSFDNNMPGNDNTSFVLVGNQLRSNSSYNFENKSTYTVYITANSGASTSFSKLIQIFVRNQNDAPTDISLSFNTIRENRPSGSFIGIFSSSDADAISSFSYSLVNGIGATDNS